MPKSDLISSVEKISERISRKVLRECKSFATIGTWIKTLQDENRSLKRRVEELEIRVRKLNTYGPTKSKIEVGSTALSSTETPEVPLLSLAQIRRVRTVRGLSQQQFALLLGISHSRYNKWERGLTRIPVEFNRKIREFRELKASDLRTALQNVGIFQPNGKPQPSSRKNEFASVETRRTTEKQTIIPVNAYSGNTVPVQSQAEPTKTGSMQPSLLADEIRGIRASLGLTQREIAAKLKISEKRYKNWEQGRVNTPLEFIRKIRKLAPRNTKTETIFSSENASTPQTPPLVLSAEQLKDIRTQLGLSQSQMAEALKIKKNRYVNWECNIAKAGPEFVKNILKIRDEKRRRRSSTGIKSEETTAVVAASTNHIMDLLNPKKIPTVLSAMQLKEIRSFLKLTQQQMAKKLRLAESSYANWERAHRKVPVRFIPEILKLLSNQLSKSTEFSDRQKNSMQNGSKKEVLLSPEKLRNIRSKLEFTQAQLAATLGITESRYKNWEHGSVILPTEFAEKIQALASSGKSEEKTISASRTPSTQITVEQLKKIRTIFGLSLTQMAILLGVSRGQYSHWENGYRKIPADRAVEIKRLRRLSVAERTALLEKNGISPITNKHKAVK